MTDEFYSGVLTGTVFGLTATYAKWAFGLLVGLAAASLVYLGVDSGGMGAFIQQLSEIIQLLREDRQEFSLGLAVGFTGALVLGIYRPEKASEASLRRGVDNTG